MPSNSVQCFSIFFYFKMQKNICWAEFTITEDQNQHVKAMRLYLNVSDRQKGSCPLCIKSMCQNTVLYISLIYYCTVHSIISKLFIHTYKKTLILIFKS